MADEVILTWNTTNWITVVLMVALGFFALGAVSKVIRNAAAKG